MRRTASLWLVASSIVFLLATASARTRPRQGGTLRIEMRADVSLWINSSVRMLVFDSLTQLDEDGRVQPSLALRWDSQSDSRRWQLWLRPDVRFHDGTPLSAATVVQSLTAQDCSGCPWRSVHVSGDAVVFESEAPIPNLPAILANSRYAIARRDDAGNEVGTGAFRYASTANGAVTLNAVEDSWHPRPYVNAIEVRGGRSLRDQWMDVGAGRADIVEVPAEQLRHAQQDRMRLLVSRDTDLLALVVNGDDPAAQDQRIREALALSLDRAALLNGVFQKQGEVTASLLPNWLSGYSFAFPAVPNLTKARDLRAQLARPPELTISVDGNDPLLQLIADRLVLNARDAGLVVRPLTTPGRSTLRLTRVHVEESSPAAAFADVAGQLSPGVSVPADDVVAVFHADEALVGKRNIIPLLYTSRAVAISSRVHEVKLAGDGLLRVADFWVEDGK
jgi:peptide/nickel transport system substrate-binding protein